MFRGVQEDIFGNKDNVTRPVHVGRRGPRSRDSAGSRRREHTTRSETDQLELPRHVVSGLTGSKFGRSGTTLGRFGKANRRPNALGVSAMGVEVVLFGRLPW